MAAAEQDLPGIIIGVVIAGIILFVGFQAMNVAVVTLPFGGVDDGSVPVTDGAARVENADNVSQVRDTTGRAASLSGGQVAISGGLGVRDDADREWAFGTYASVANSSRASVLWSLGQEFVVAYVPDNGGQYVAWYYNETTTNSYAVSVAAGQPANLSPLILERESGTLVLQNESGATASVAITPGTDSTAPLPTSQNLVGRLDETRTWDRPLTSAEAQSYRSDGIDPVAVGNRTSRLMFDTAGSRVAVEYRSADGELTGAASRGQGLAATTMTRGSDFAVQHDDQGLTVVIADGGQLEDMPRVAVATSGLASPYAPAVPGIANAFTLVGIVMVLAMLSFVVLLLRQSR